jgi:putative transcriptional regulator
MSNDSTTKTKSKDKPASQDWAAFDAMTPEERHAAAMSDPDCQPTTPEDSMYRKRTPQVKVIRRAMELSQEDFSERFRIPLGTLRDWEQGRKEPDAAARAYLTVIAVDPDAVSKALLSAPRLA